MSIDDPVIGPLTFEDYGLPTWTREDSLDILGGSIRLDIGADSQGPTELQRQVYITCKQMPMSVRDELQEAIFEFYKVEREAYAEVCGDIEGYVEEFLPVLEESSSIWGIIQPNYWRIMGPEPSDDGTIEVSDRYDATISWNGCWDVEHEFCALLKDGKLVSIEGPGGDFS